MSLGKIISTNAFEAFQTEQGYSIMENNKAYRKTSVPILVLGLICVAFSFVAAEIPFKKFLVAILSNGLFYGGIVAVFGGLLYLILSLKKKTIEFNTKTRMLQFGRRKIPFDSITEISLEVNEVFGRRIAKIKIKESGITSPFIGPPILLKENANELRNFVDELNGTIRS